MGTPKQSSSRLVPDSDDTSESEDEFADVAAASIRVMTESAARMDLEMGRAREFARAKAEMKRAELETELTQIVAQTQLQIAEFVAKAGLDRKRKNPGAENHTRRMVGKVAIVTASTQGIGFSIAERLAIEGASVVISSRKQKNVDEAVEKLRGKGLEVFGVVCHVSNAQQRKALIEKTVQKYGKIDVVVSNAAVNPSVDSILETKESVLDKLWEINVKASILLLQDAAPQMTTNSSVVLISSIAGYNPDSSLAMYGVTKTALLGLTKALASDMAPNTRVNCVAPGFVPTHFAEFLTTNDAIREGIEGKTLLKRLGKTEEIAAATVFLASDDASYITGETLVVAGGIHARL